MAVGLSNPQVTVNNQPLDIVPNTLTYDAGEGEINVRAASGGGGRATTVHTVNAETKMSKVTFEVYLTPEVDGLISEWKLAINANAISFSERVAGNSVTRTFPNCSLINAVERSASADGTVSLEFSGDPMISG